MTLQGGKPLIVEDLDVTMSVRTYDDPAVQRFWRLRAIGAFWGLCRHPWDVQNEVMGRIWGFERGQRIRIMDSSGKAEEATVMEVRYVDQYRSVWQRLAILWRRYRWLTRR